MTRAALRAAAVLAAAACVSAAPFQSLPDIERDVFLMGTRARLVTTDTSRDAGLARLERLLASLEATEAALSTWRPDSEISRLNRAPVGSAFALSPEACRLFAALRDWTRDTDRAFDPAIGALTDAWDIHGRGRVPSDAELAAARAHSGFDHLGFDEAGCTITRAVDVRVDVGAFGKGEAVDRARTALGDDAAPWLIDLGGQLGVGTSPSRPAWPAALAHPFHRQRAVAELVLRGGSLGTSAGSESDLLVDGRRIGHILDPRTGRPAPFTGSATAWHEHGLAADVLSTALFVMGREEGRRWAEARGVAALFLEPREDGGVDRYATPAFRAVQ